MSIRQIFRNLISYKFKNERNQVKTAYLDHYFVKFANKSNTYDYTLHKRVLYQFANTFNTKSNIKSLLHSKMLQSIFLDKWQIAIEILEDYVYQIHTILNDLTGSSNPHIFISQILQKYNNCILSLEAIQPHIEPKPVNLDKLERFVEYKYQPPKPILPYYSRYPVLTHRKGHRGFVRDYEYQQHW